MNLSIWAIAVISLLLSSCAKKLEEEKDTDIGRTPRNQASVDPDIQSFFRTQIAYCEEDCHPAVAKLVVYDRGNVEYCTATLISKNVLVTSANCLFRNLRVPHISCVNNIFAIFPSTGYYTKSSAMCDEVLSASLNVGYGDPALWKGDFAFIKLREPVDRRPVDISRNGLKEGEAYLSYRMDFLSDTIAKQEKEVCKPLFNTYANPFAQNVNSPMIPVSDCSFKEGNMGAPLFNVKGQLAGLLSSKMDEGLSTYVNDNDIMAEEMASIQHASNFACADVPLSWERSFSSDKECFKKIDITRLDRLRSKLLNSMEIHEENMAAIEAEVEKPSKYFKWDLKFYSDRRASTLEAHYGMPKCFFDIESWIAEFSRGVWRRNVYTYGFVEVEHPSYTLRAKLNRLLKPVSVVEEGEPKLYKMEFNPANAYFSQSTDITVNGTLFGREVSQAYSNITDQCGDD